MTHNLMARPGQSLSDHLKNTAIRAEDFARMFGLPTAGWLLGACHDEGKGSAAFQNYIRSATGLLDLEDEGYVDATSLRGKIDHSTAGAQKVWRSVGRSRPQRQDNLFAQMLALCIISHHSGLIDCLGPDGEQCFNKRMGKGDDATHLREVVAIFGQDCGAPGQELLPNTMLEMRRRLASMLRPEKSLLCNDCLLDQKACSIRNPLTWFSLGLMTRMLLSCLLDADRIDSADAEHPGNAALRTTGAPIWPELVLRLERKLAGFIVNRPIDVVRKKVSEHCLGRAGDAKGLFTLTVPTGGGKTLSGLRFALHHAAHHGMDRIIHVIPFTSIIDQNAQVARDILEHSAEFGRFVLEHHSNLEPDKETLRSRLAAECWDAPVIYTTMVQFLESLFSGGTRNARRMHRLANAVLVFDEIQTLPVNCAHLFCNAVNFLVQECGASVVLCTATQPLLDRLEQPERGVLTLEPERELMPDKEGLFNDLKRVEIIDQTRPIGWSVGNVANLAVGEYQRTGSCLVVVNTKKWARELYEECARRGVVGLYHLSTGMCPAHRLNVLQAMRGRLGEDPVLCVSTQLIEAGVDISFGAVVRFLAGLDSIVQAAGRCNRNGEDNIGQVHIVNPDREELGKLKEIRVGQECARRVLDEFMSDPASLGGSLLHPLAMERYFSYAFFARRRDMVYPVSSDEAERDDTLLNMLSCNPQNPGNMHFQPSLRQSFAKAGGLFRVIDAPTQGIIVPYRDGAELIAKLCGVFDPKQQGPLLRLAQRYSVNVFPNVRKQLHEAQAVHETQAGSDIWYLDARHYCEQFGLSLTMVEEMNTFICDGGACEK